MDRLKGKIAQVYYNHGLFCATHPVQVVVVVCIIVVIVSSPVTQLLLVSDIPLDHIVLREDEFDNFKNSRLLFSDDNKKQNLGYTLQVILRSKSTSALHLDCDIGYQAVVDAVSQSFRIVQLVRQFQSSKRTALNPRGLTFNDLCFQVEDRVVAAHKAANLPMDNVLPTFDCLLLSPSLLWVGDRGEADLLTFKASQHAAKLFNHLKRAAVGNLRDLAFGIPWKMTGIHRFSTCHKEATVVFAVTLVFRNYDPEFLSELHQYLASHYQVKPRDEGSSASTGELHSGEDEDVRAQQSNGIPEPGHIYLVWYRGRSYLSDYAPLLCIYLILLNYVYFSVSKLEMVKSKCGLAISACFTVVASLCMSIAICLSIGLMVPTLSGREVFPYLVVLIGFENIVILTKSVVATPIDLPVKYRIAQGLRKESWPLTKHYFAKLLLLGLGFFTFHPHMQEFCLIAAVGLSTDFFLQLFFFVTVLSIDIRRMELTDLSQQHSSLSLLRDPRQLLAVNGQAVSCVTRLSDGRQLYGYPTAPSREEEACCGEHTADCRLQSTVLPTAPPTTTPLGVSRLSRSAARFLSPTGAWLEQLAVRMVPRPLCRLVACGRRLKSPFKRHRRKVSAAQAAAFLASDDKAAENVPIRLRVLRTWAKHRLFQRIFLWSLVIWLACFLLYTVDFSQLFATRLSNGQPSTADNSTEMANSTLQAMVETGGSGTRLTSPSSDEPFTSTEQREPIAGNGSGSSGSPVGKKPRKANPLWMPGVVGADDGQDENIFLWNYLAVFQWPLLASHYNLTLAGNHLVLLEPIRLRQVTHHYPPASSPSPPLAASKAASALSGFDGSAGLDDHSAESALDDEAGASRLFGAWDELTGGGDSTPIPPPAPPPVAVVVTRETGADADHLLHARIRNSHSSPSTSPGGFAGWTDRLWLTASLAGTTLVGCSLVLCATCLGMVVLHELPLSKSSAPSNREPVIRVLPQTIHLSSPSVGVPRRETTTESDRHQRRWQQQQRRRGMRSSTLGWTFACGQMAALTDSPGSAQFSAQQGVIAAAVTSADKSGTDAVHLWSTDSGCPLTSLYRYSEDAVAMRQLASDNLKRCCRPTSTVWCMSFLPELGRLAVGCSDGTIEIWDCNQRRLHRLLSVLDSSRADQCSQTDGVTTKLLPTSNGTLPTNCPGLHRDWQQSKPADPTRLVSDQHPGGITVMQVLQDSSILVGSSHGHLTWFPEGDSTGPMGPRGCRPHASTVTQLSVDCLLSEGSAGGVPPEAAGDGATQCGRTVAMRWLAATGCQDGSVVITSLDSGQALFTSCISPTPIIGLNFEDMVLAVSYASGGLHVILLTSEFDASSNRLTGLKEIDSVSLLEERSSPTQAPGQVAAERRPTTTSSAPSVSLRLVHRPACSAKAQARQSPDGGRLACFRLIAYDLDGSIVIWSLKPRQVVRSFKCNFSPLLSTSPVLTVSDRLVFGDQSYLRVVNPWTAKYERSIHLIPPSTTVLQDGRLSPVHHLSTKVLSEVLRNWSRELVPLGVANRLRWPTSSSPLQKGEEEEGEGGSGLNNAVLVSLADAGQALVVIPLSTVC